jgi:hypothetical protein
MFFKSKRTVFGKLVNAFALFGYSMSTEEWT